MTKLFPKLVYRAQKGKEWFFYKILGGLLGDFIKKKKKTKNQNQKPKNRTEPLAPLLPLLLPPSLRCAMLVELFKVRDETWLDGWRPSTDQKKKEKKRKKENVRKIIKKL